VADTATQTPKKTSRKPDPMTRAITDMKAAAKHLGDFQVQPVPKDRAALHDRRSAAWGREYADSGTFDALVLSLAFEALAGLNPAERRYSLLQLSAVALDEVVKLDGAE
jgi:hypothetical protein